LVSTICGIIRLIVQYVFFRFVDNVEPYGIYGYECVVSPDDTFTTTASLIDDVG